MAAYTLPATIVLKNLKTTTTGHETDLWNPGLVAVATGESLNPSETLEDCLPALNTADFAGTVQIPVYGNAGQYYTLKPNESITVTPKTDEEALFYMAMAKEGVLSATPA